MLFIVATLVGLLGLLLGALRGQVTPFWVTLGYLVAVWIGYILVDAREVTSATVWYTVLVVVLTVGYVAGRAVAVNRRRAAGEPPATLGAEATAYATRQLKLLLAVITALCLFHFARIGLPLLADDIALARWRTTESGLYGIPSRALQIGVPFAYFFAVALSSRADPTRYRMLVGLRRWALALLVVTRLVAGFKGGLVQVIIVIFMAQLLSGRGRRRLAQVSMRFAVPVLLAFGFAVFVGSLYGGVQVRLADDGGNVTTLFVDRATAGAAEPSRILVEDRLTEADLFVPEDPFVHDLVHYVRTYTPGLNSTGEPFSKHVSSAITGRDLDGDLFVVPTTPGLAALLFFSFGPVLAAVLVALVGGIYGYIELLPAMTRSVFGSAVWMAAVFNLHLAVTKGNLVYQAVNFSVMVLLLYLLVLQVPRRTSRAPVATSRVRAQA